MAGEGLGGYSRNHNSARNCSGALPWQVCALGRMDDIKDAFKDNIKGDIERGLRLRPANSPSKTARLHR